MLIRCFSDLHIEFWSATKLKDQLSIVVPFLDTDKETVVVIAGDLGLFHHPEVWTKILSLLSKRFKAIIYVAGNHEFYHNDWIDNFAIRKISLPKNVYLLENQCVFVDDICFIGATLWSKFDLEDDMLIRHAERSINDFHCIKWKDGKRFTPEDSTRLFTLSSEYIFNKLKEVKDSVRKTVVVTHHGCSYKSVHPRFAGDLLNSVFVSDLDEPIITNGPDIYVHGHVHNSFDYMLGNTRVITNPYGYKNRDENYEYNKELVIEI
jgi:predicted phosphohydrolase